jgi:hypothetical protein
MGVQDVVLLEQDCLTSSAGMPLENWPLLGMAIASSQTSIATKPLVNGLNTLQQIKAL